MRRTEAIEAPPPFKPVDAIQLSAVQDSKIIGVSVYTGRAEITRLFKFKVRTGDNQIIINGLPTVLDNDSLRVEGRGAATIHDVTISDLARTSTTTSLALQALEDKKDLLVKAQERCEKSLLALESYLRTCNVEHIAMSQLNSVIGEYDKTAEALDIRSMKLEQELKGIEKDIDAEREKLADNSFNGRLSRRAAIGLFVALEGEVEIALVYAVGGASWDAGYDVRVDMQTKGEQVTLIYKAAITQSTGEDWTDVPLTLETAAPTFGIEVPTLDTWNLSTFKSVPVSAPRFSAIPPPPRGGLQPMMMLGGSRDFAPESSVSAMKHHKLFVTSKGNVSATFQVPGMISIPSDGDAHNVTIVQLKLNATMSWVCVPKKDTKVHLKAKVKNVSEYTLLPGTGSFYVDGSFISRSGVPAVSPGEGFDCSLGLDPSIRVTYHQMVKKVSQGGFYSKTSNHVYSQQITVFNTKASHVDDVRIIDQVPVSEDDQIKVKLVNPPLTVGPTGSGEGGNVGKDKDKALRKVATIKGVVAQWDGADDLEIDGDVEALGRNGKINWVCSVPPHGKVNVVLQWEVTAPLNADVVGL